MGNAEISFGNNFLEIRYQREKEIPELHHLQMENGNWKMENSIANIMETAWNSSSYILHKLYLLYLSRWACTWFIFSWQLREAPFWNVLVLYEHRPNSFSAIGTVGKMWHLRCCEFYMSICPSPYRKCQALSRLSPPFQSIICSYVQCSDELVSEDAFCWGLL